MGTTQRFHISDVLSVALEVLVSRNGIDGVHELCQFMAGGALAPHQLVRATKAIQPFLVKSLPKLQPVIDGSEYLVLSLTNRLSATGPRAAGRGGNRARIIEDWVEDVQLKFGLPDHLDLPQIPYDRANPIDEFIVMAEATEDK